ncbi:MAG: hypothetical protein KAV99_03520 [Candidatus Latescibacteria bacterium]|nr:hypothetical protein [Candidatus Latescibacterota bacterium]
MIRRYFTRVKRKFQEFSSLIKSELVEYELVSEEMGIINDQITITTLAHPQREILEPLYYDLSSKL